eukprot:1147858-Pelagomonas_calceolata.AAC.10
MEPLQLKERIQTGHDDATLFGNKKIQPLMHTGKNGKARAEDLTAGLDQTLLRHGLILSSTLINSHL